MDQDTQSIQGLVNQLQNLDANQMSQLGDLSERTATSMYASLFGWGIFAALVNMWISWVIAIISIISLWFIFVKANKPGWAAIIPFYNIWVMLEMIGKPWWWLLLLFIPLVNIVVAILMCRELARVFGQGVAFTVGLVLLSFVFMPILAFGQYKYEKPQVK